MIGGGFTAVNHVARWRVAQLLGDAPSGPTITSITVANGVVGLIWNAVVGRTYRVQCTPSLSPSAWQNLVPDITATTTTGSTTDAPVVAQRFYRVVELP